MNREDNLQDTATPDICGGQAQGAPDAGQAMKPVPGIKHILLVASGKGGVGKSTVAVNIAYALRAAELAVGILDADLYGPSIARMVGSGAGLDQNDRGQTIPFDSHGIPTLSTANVLPPEAALVWKGPLVSQALTQMFYEVAWPELDVLVVDLPPGTGDVQLTILEQVPVSGAIVVSTPQKLALIDADRGVTMFHELDIPVFGLIENMAYYICPCCGEQQAIFPDGDARQLAHRRHVPYLGKIPLEPAAQSAADWGLPVVMAQPDSDMAKCFTGIADQIAVSLRREDQARRRAQDHRVRQASAQFWENLLD